LFYESDFVMPGQRNEVAVIECQWSRPALDGAALSVFRSYYPTGRNYLITPSAAPAHVERFGAHEVTVCHPSGLIL
jgi:hypothetical protein